MSGVRSRVIVYPRGGSTRLASSVIIIPPCSVLAAVVSGGPTKTSGSINVIAGVRKASMAKPRLGTGSRALSDAASPT